MNELLPTTITDFFDRFYNCYDGLIRNVNINYPSKGALVVLSVQDQKAQKDEGWVNLHLYIENFTEFILRESKSTCVVLSSGLQIGFFDSTLYLDFCPFSEAPEGIDDFKKSDFLIAGKKCIWSVLPYSEPDRSD